MIRLTSHLDFTSPFQLSLFFDVMLPMATGVTETDFVNGKWSRNATPNDPESQRRMKKARSLLWKELGGYKMWACKCYNEIGYFRV